MPEDLEPEADIVTVIKELRLVKQSVQESQESRDEMLKLMKRQLRKKDLETEKIRTQLAAYQTAEGEMINDGFSDRLNTRQEQRRSGRD